MPRTTSSQSGSRWQSLAAANAYLAFSGSLAKGSLPRKLREQISLVVGETNSCDYCVAAHTLLGGKAGLTQDKTLAARAAASADPKTEAALVFAKKVVTERGHVTDEDVAGLRQHGYTDGDIAEMVANTALNILTNYFNHVAGTVVDFPAAPKLAACACSH
jgi:AhpD family alkylhydroperoxidase